MANKFLRKVVLFSGLTDDEFVQLADLTPSHKDKKGAFMVMAEDIRQT